MFRPAYFFAQTSTGAGTGLDILKPVPTESVSAITRSKAIFCPALSTICINISGTATVNIISNPFDDPAKDKIFQVVTATGHFVVDSAAIIIVDVTAISGTVSARAVLNQELDD
jgi:hypothetical protein